jgi:hypothetical protein
MILKAKPTGASAPDRGTDVGKAEGERPDKISLRHVWMLRWQPHHHNQMLMADNPLILNYSSQGNQYNRPYASLRSKRIYYYYCVSAPALGPTQPPVQ